MATFNIFLFLILVVCFFLIVVVMVQNPKGGGLSSTFGGNTQVVGGVKNTSNFLDKSTWTLGIVLVVLILVSNTFISGRFESADSKLLEGNNTEVPVQQTSPLDNTTPATTPADSL